MVLHVLSPPQFHPSIFILVKRFYENGENHFNISVTREKV
ncbi:hypothetical protein KR50_09210 [Jeotgalibacillus campisalis]|uniref:Uncharacterized protein n=1 Tax=Jeotgalibacillus campisalis TaxID=220754 RepID=A0A0C2W347_9BACL|nr:hypothetical protein KR50_09210 [Jeotgalibacillus campisalis]